MEKHNYAMVVYFSKEDGVWIVDYPELPGCVSHGNTPIEAIEMGEEAKGLWLEVAVNQKFNVPERKISTYESAEEFIKSGLEGIK